MNWLDFLLIGVVVVSAVTGLRMGLLGAAALAAGGYVGWLAASQLSGVAGGVVGSGRADTLVTVVSYAIIIALGVVAARFIFKAAKPFLTAATMGLSSVADRVGGLVLGTVLGLALLGATIVGLARLTYDFAPSELPRVEDSTQALEDALKGSRTVPVFIKVANTIPGSTLGLIPSDFRSALDILED